MGITQCILKKKKPNKKKKLKKKKKKKKRFGHIQSKLQEYGQTDAFEHFFRYIVTMLLLKLQNRI